MAEKKAQEFDEGIEDAKANMFSYNLVDCDNITPSDLVISTITFLFLTTIASINIENITQLFTSTTRMRNCVIYKFHITEKRKCAIKIFRNGKFHITGCKSACEAMRILSNILLSIDPTATITDFQVQMINSNFHFQRAIDLYELAKIFQLRQEPYNYNKDHHHAFRFKCEGVSVLVFMSGSVIITGAKSSDTLLAAYKKIVGVVESEFFNGILLQHYEPRKRPRLD
jgi:TATA-box binding protein (TBP) (component of TFIID and TFIIIB)